jgi:hypothetical protein
MIDFTPYINKADMQEIASYIRDIFWASEEEDVTYLKDQSIDNNGWVITFSGSIKDREIQIDEITFSPAFAEQANELINL